MMNESTIAASIAVSSGGPEIQLSVLFIKALIISSFVGAGIGVWNARKFCNLIEVAAFGLVGAIFGPLLLSIGWAAWEGIVYVITA